MAWVESARQQGFSLQLHEDVMRDILVGASVAELTAREGEDVAEQVKTHVRAVASTESAENYVGAMRVEHGISDQYGFDFDGPYELGSRPIAVVAIPEGRGPNPNAKPPLMVEAETHALTSVPGFVVGATGEDIR